MKLPNILEPCKAAAAWLETQPDPQAAWQNCQRPDWMLWLLNELNYLDERVMRLYACWCARETPLSDGRRVWDLMTDERSRAAVEVAEFFAAGEATLEELRDAARAASDAAWAAARAASDAARDAAWAAARAAAGAAAWAAAWAAARDAAWAAARAAAWDAARAAAWDAARAAAWDAAGAAQSDQLRKLVPFSVVEELLAAITEGR